jgi:hypothetical protein
MGERFIKDMTRESSHVMKNHPVLEPAIVRSTIGLYYYLVYNGRLLGGDKTTVH